MAARSKRLAMGALVAGTQVVVYTVPAGKTALVKLITFEDAGGQPINCTAAVEVAGSMVHFWHVVSSGMYESVFWSQTVAAEAGDELVLGCDSGGPVGYYVSGAELDA